MTTIALVQARMGSDRLPGKVLMDIAGRPMIEQVLRRVKAAPGIGEVILCVPRNEATTLPPPNGSYSAPDVEPNNVLGRFAVPANAFPLDTVVVRITGDCPLIDPMVIAGAVKVFNDYEGEWFVDGSEAVGAIDGLDVEVFSAAMLANAHAAATDPMDREHVTPWMKRNYPVISCTPHRNGNLPDGARRKWSVDTQDDLDFVREVYGALGSGMWGFPAVRDYLTRKAGL